MTSIREISARRDLVSAVSQPVGLLWHGYRHWDLMRQRSGSEVVQTRLARERVTVIRGARAAQFFYEVPEQERASALPTPLVGVLFGGGAVHTLDGSRHAHRKIMFNRMLDEPASAAVVAAIVRRWEERAPHWSGTIDVFDEIAEILFEAVCEWVGLPSAESRSRTHDMLAMVDGFGAPSGRQIAARAARRRTEAWVESAVEAARHGETPRTHPLGIIVSHRDEAGDLLDVHTAAVEIINLIRPLVAVSWLVSGLARACRVRSHWREEVRAETVSAMDMAQEVRRTYPFVPFLATRATADLSYHDVAIPAGSLIVLDAWGTNHDPATWRQPDVFEPERFRRTPVTPYNLVPQGGGDRHTGHRCPGEDMTLAVLVALVPRLAALRYAVVEGPPELRRMPPRPHTHLRIR